MFLLLLLQIIFVAFFLVQILSTSTLAHCAQAAALVAMADNECPVRGFKIYPSFLHLSILLLSRAKIPTVV